MMATSFRSPSVLCVLTCLLYFFLEPVASEGLCGFSNVEVLQGQSLDPLPPFSFVTLEQPLCFGCVFTLPDFSTNPFPLGTEWDIISSGSSETLTNSSSGVTLSGINGTIHFEKASNFLTFGGSQIRCTFTDNGMDFELSAAFVEISLDKPVIANTTDDGEILGIEGQSVILSCTNEEPPGGQIEQFEWFDFAGNPLDTTPGLNRPHVLVLNNVSRNQSGLYKCVVSVAEVSSSTNATLVVQYPGLILSGPIASPSLTLHTGSNLTLTCTFEGLPAPNVTWTVDGNTVIDNDRQSVQTTEESTQLVFTPVIGEDSGSYRCTANNTIGNSVSDAVNVKVQVPPDPVMDLMVTSRSTDSVSLGWILGFNGNSNITSVTVSYITSDNFKMVDSESVDLDNVDGVPVTSHVFSELEPHTQYNFTVLAINAVGNSQPTTVQEWTLPLRPAAPTDVSVDPLSSTSLTVKWMEPPFDSFTQTDFGTYSIEFTTGSITEVDSISYPASMHTITQLMKGTYYSVRVALDNSAGMGDYSSPSVTNRTNIDPPTEVINLVVTPFPSALCASWEAPADDGGSPIISYRVELEPPDSTATPTPFLGADTLFHSFEGLVANTNYTVRVAAVNGEAGVGNFIAVSKTIGSDFNILEAFTLTNNYISAVSINVSWSAQSGASNYTVQYRKLGEEPWIERSCICTYYLISGLEPETTYEIRAILIGSNNCTRLSSPTVKANTSEVVVTVIPSVEDTVFTGMEIRLSCNLDTGENAPSVTWNRTDGLELPADVVMQENVLIIPSAVPSDSGGYICFSGDANFTYSLVVQDPPITSSTPTPLATTGLELYIVIIIAAVAAISVVAFVVVLLIAIYCCCCHHNSAKKSNYVLKKSGAANVWMDEGAGGFIPSTMNPNTSYRITNDDIDAPVDIGRRMTTDNQYTSATSFKDEQIKKGAQEYAELELQQQQGNVSFPNKENRVEYMTVGSSTFHGSKERIISSTTTDV